MDNPDILIAAARAGARVQVVEAAPKFYRGGNTRHTRNMRCAHDHATGTLTGPYTETEFLDDLMRVTNGHTDVDLSRMISALSRFIQKGVANLGGVLYYRTYVLSRRT
jgi:tricarballylate dehydrogenase